MSHVEESLLRCLSGPKIMMMGFAIALVGILPLALYIAFGPADGNPIGLGLLGAVSLPVAGVVVIVGVIKTMIQYLGVRGR